MNIQALSETELNRAMIWLYPPEHRKHHPFKDHGEYCCSGSYEDTIDYDYLGDYNQTMPLAFESNLNIESPTFMRKLFRVYQYYIIPNTGERCREVVNKDPLRAICEVLVMIGMEGE